MPPEARHEPALDLGAVGAGSVFDAWQSAVASGWRALAAPWQPADARALRERWLAELRRATSEALRSPAFLALMKLNLTLVARRTPAPSAR